MTYKGIYSKRCWLDGQLKEATILFERGVITTIVDGKPTDENGILDAGNSIVMPGIIDAHVHVNEPGRTEWEGFDTATQAAAAGGITTIIDMPLNASPVTTTAIALQQKLAATEGKMHVNVGFYGGVVPGNKNELEGLINGGILGLKAFLTHSGIDEFPNVMEDDLNAVMPLIATHNLPLLAHCELSDDDFEDALNKQPTSYKAYLASRPKEWENEAVSMMINLCRKHDCKTHIVHVSSAEALPLIKSAKEEGLPLTAETCAHYIYFNAEDIPNAQTIYKCAPPIREKQNNDHLKEALQEGVLDFITTDHSPAPPAIKEMETGNLQKAWGGIAGLQFLLPASWTALKDRLPLQEFIPLLTEAPAKFLGVPHQKGYLQVGFDADITVWNEDETFEVKEENILHRHKATPYSGQHLAGVVHHTMVHGELVYSNQNIIQKNKGQWLLRK
jgi:allantoinase